VFLFNDSKKSDRAKSSSCLSVEVSESRGRRKGFIVVLRVCLYDVFTSLFIPIKVEYV
jgi:hypothetical protein